MNGLNGIIIDGKVYEAVQTFDCGLCAFDNDVKTCRFFCDICNRWNCAFRYSRELTDKINSNGIQQKDTSAGI